MLFTSHLDCILAGLENIQTLWAWVRADICIGMSFVIEVHLTSCASILNRSDSYWVPRSKSLLRSSPRILNPVPTRSIQTMSESS